MLAGLSGSLACGGCSCMRLSGAVNGVSHDSSAVMFRGYKNTVLVNTDPRSIFDMWSGPEEIMKFGVFKSVKQAGTGTDMRVPGNRVRIRMRVGGIDWNLIFTNVRTGIRDGVYEIWFAATEPTFHFQRWGLFPAQGGARVDFRFFGQPPRVWGSEEVYWTELVDYFTALFDNTLANLQCLSDPGFDRKTYLSGPAKGELFDVIFKRYQVVTRVMTGRGKAFDYLAASDDLMAVLGEPGSAVIRQGSGHDSMFRYESVIGGRDTHVEGFTVEHKEGRIIKRVMTWANYLVGVDLSVRPCPVGSLVKTEAIVELPDPGTRESLDFTIDIAETPQRLESALARMKDRLEQGRT